MLNAKFSRTIFLSLIFVLIFGPLAAFALNLDKIKAAYLNGEYKIAISEGEKILLTSVNHGGFDELYYYLGLSYLKDSNYVRAEDMFGRVIVELKDSKFTGQAKLALGDTYFMQGEFEKAEALYNELLDAQDTKLKPAVLYRLSQIAMKKGDRAKSSQYLKSLKDDYPFCLEAKLDKEVSVVTNKAVPESAPLDVPSGPVYSVQVGFFSSKENAQNFTKELKDNDIPAYVEEDTVDSKVSYRVKVGKLKTRQEALDLQKQLAGKGYSTKICP
jgi:tetratricopeptide (TPR) repeat protein